MSRMTSWELSDQVLLETKKKKAENLQEKLPLEQLLRVLVSLHKFLLDLFKRSLRFVCMFRTCVNVIGVIGMKWRIYTPIADTTFTESDYMNISMATYLFQTQTFIPSIQLI